jgi:hypothetical protein
MNRVGAIAASVESLEKRYPRGAKKSMRWPARSSRDAFTRRSFPEYSRWMAFAGLVALFRVALTDPRVSQVLIPRRNRLSDPPFWALAFQRFRSSALTLVTRLAILSLPIRGKTEEGWIYRCWKSGPGWHYELCATFSTTDSCPG